MEEKRRREVHLEAAVQVHLRISDTVETDWRQLPLEELIEVNRGFYQSPRKSHLIGSTEEEEGSSSDLSARRRHPLQ